MSYKVVYTKSSVKDIKKLDTVAKKRLKKKIEVYAKAPLKNAKRLVDNRLGDFRWRAGNYRIVFDIDGNTIVVLRIRHRKDVYK